MCQLTFIHIPGDSNLEKTLLTAQFLTNSKLTHTDGWGFYSNGKLFKSKLNASLTSNLGELINEFLIGNEPIIAHVRAASFGTEVKRENSHPFETESFILAHNGTLAFRKKESEEKWEELCKKNKNYKDMIDSEIFATVLQQDYNANVGKTFSVVIKETMEKFFGKFAFLIYVKPEETYYIVRGTSATLWASQVLIKDKPIGILINTEKSDLDKVVDFIKQVSDSLKKNDLNFSETEAVDAGKTFIYSKDKFELIEIDEIVQNHIAITTTKTAERKTHTSNPNYYNSYGYLNRGAWDEDYFDVLEQDEFTKNIEKIDAFMRLVGFGIKDLERLAHYTFGDSLLELDGDKYELLANDVIPALSLFYSEYKGNLWTNFCNERINSKFYLTKDAQYPYFLNTNEVLTEAFATLMKEKAEISVH